MNAFNDIWFGVGSEHKPRFVRGGNSDWHERSFGKMTYWESYPLDSEKNPFVSSYEDDNYRLILLGQLYEDLTVGKLFNRCIRYIEDSQRFIDPAGHYIIFVLDKKKGQLHVFTNRFGTYQAYFLSEGMGSAIATPFISLAKQSKDKALDWEGVTSFLGQGFFANNNTFLKKIKILEPSSHYLFGNDLQKISHRRYWQWEHNIVDQRLNDAVESVHESLLNSITTATRNQRVALPISGGLDSRTLLGVLTEKEQEYNSLWSYSYGYSKRSIETRIAQKLARVKNISFNGYKLPNYLFDRIDVIAESVDLFQYIDGTRQASMIDILKEKSDVVIGGHWGDVWFDNMGVDNEEELLPYYQKKIIKKGSQWLLENICKDHVLQPEELLKDNFNSFMSKYEHIKDVDFRMKIFKTDQWSFRWTLPSIRMYQAGSMPILPFYDKNVAYTLTSVPTKQLAGRSFQIEYIKAKYPDLAKVRWQEYGTNLYLYKKINNRNLIYRGLKKGQRMITPGKHIIRNWELFYLNSNGRKELESIFFDDKFKDVLPHHKINRLLNEFYLTPNSSNGYTISMLHTFLQFLKRIL
ncbi:MAG: hypothetical protein R2800_10730 [Flavipsychrobacter sp.]